jgi:hypothetical protein
LYFHLIALFVGIGAGAVILACLLQLRGARNLEDAVPWGMLAGKTEKAFPVAIIGLFVTGAYMTSDVWTWDTGWIVVAIVGLVFLALNGPLVAGRAAHKLKASLQENGPGPLGESARRTARHPGLWIGELTNLGVVLGIVWNMTLKPSSGEAVAAVLIGWFVGAILGYWLSRLPAESAVGSIETAP